VRRSDVIAAGALVALLSAIGWIETPPVGEPYFQGAWERPNADCAGGAERLVFDGDRLAWSDPEGHTAATDIAFVGADRLEGVRFDIRGSASEIPTKCGLPTKDVRIYVRAVPGGWIFRDDPARPWARPDGS